MQKIKMKPAYNRKRFSKCKKSTKKLNQNEPIDQR